MRDEIFERRCLKAYAGLDQIPMCLRRLLAQATTRWVFAHNAYLVVIKNAT